MSASLHLIRHRLVSHCGENSSFPFLFPFTLRGLQMSKPIRGTIAEYTIPRPAKPTAETMKGFGGAAARLARVSAIGGHIGADRLVRFRGRYCPAIHGEPVPNGISYKPPGPPIATDPIVVYDSDGWWGQVLSWPPYIPIGNQSTCLRFKGPHMANVGMFCALDKWDDYAKMWTLLTAWGAPRALGFAVELWSTQQRRTTRNEG